MTTTQTHDEDRMTSTDHSRATADAAHTHGGGAPEASRAARAASFDLADFPIPTGREEEWRFTPVDRIQELFAERVDGAAPTLEVDAAEGVLVEQAPRGDQRLGLTGAPGDRAAAVAWASAPDALVVTHPADHVAPGHTTVTITGAGDAPAAQHLLIRAERHSEGIVVIDHRGTARLTQTVEVDVADGAKLTVVAIHDWDDEAVHLSAHRSRIGRDAQLKHIVVTLGGAIVRVTPDTALTAPGGEVEKLGLYFTDASQHQEHRLFVDHVAPNCTSRVTYKGALQGAGAHSVWVGDVLIRKEAEGTDTYELNRNLVLTEGSRADSVPNLEIETGEIEGAGHASATGRFDDEQLFYLRARGIPETEARRLVVRGFFAELIEQIGVPAVVDRLLGAIEAELEQTMGAAIS